MIGFRDLAVYHHLDNTSEDIREAVGEMLNDLAQPGPEQRAQREYRRLAEQLVASPEIVAWRADAGIVRSMYVGRGRICESFAGRYLQQLRPPEPAVAL